MTEKDLNRGSSANRQPNLTPGMTQSGSTTEPLTNKVGATVSNATEQVGEKVGQLTDQAKQTVTSQVSSQKQKASEALTSVAGALRQTGDQLSNNDQGAIGQYATKAADQVERLSGFLRDNDVNDIIHEAEQFARRQPAAFLGGAFALGLLAARFLKSSSQASQANRGMTYNRPGFNRYGPSRYPTAPVYRQNSPMSGRGYGPNYNPSNTPQPRQTMNTGSQMNTGGQMNTGNQTGINSYSGLNTNAQDTTSQSSNLGTKPFGTSGDREDR